MEAYLTGDTLDWNNNYIDDSPRLFVDGKANKHWTIIDILLDIFRASDPKPLKIECTPQLKQPLLDCYCLWALGRKSPSFITSLDGNIILDGHELEIEPVSHVAGLIMGRLYVVNINDRGNE